MYLYIGAPLTSAAEESKDAAARIESAAAAHAARNAGEPLCSYGPRAAARGTEHAAALSGSAGAAASPLLF